MNADMFDIEGLFKYYSKTILKESSRQPLIESEVMVDYLNSTSLGRLKDSELIRKITAEVPKRFKTVLYYDDDPALLPTSFQVSLIFDITFDINQIKNDYSSTQIDAKKDVDIDDDEIDKMIMQKMKDKGKTVVPKKQIVDLDGFFVDVFKKNIPSFTLNGRLNDLIRAGVVPIDDYKVFSVTYSTQVDDKLLYRHLDTAVKKNKPVMKSQFGYEIGFECKDRSRAKTLKEVADFTLRFAKSMDGSILKDTQYYRISEKYIAPKKTTPNV